MKKRVIAFAFICAAVFSAKAAAEARRSPVWFTRGSIYLMHLRSFTSEGTLAAAEAHLGDVKASGANIVYLTPFMTMDEDPDKAHWSPRQIESGSARNPYRIKDFFTVDAEYGTTNDLKRFVMSAHKLGLKVFFDLVFLHAAPGSLVLRDHPECFQHEKDGSFKLSWWKFPAFDGMKKETQAFYVSVIEHWVKFGADGFRCDVANDMPLETWVELRKMTQKKYPGLVLICEGCNPKNTAFAFDASYNWPVFYGHLRPILRGKQKHDIAVWAAGGVDASHLRGAAQIRFAHDAYLATCPAETLLINYIESQDTANGDGTNRMEKVFGHDNQTLGLALAYLMPGVPMVYNGQEICDENPHSIFIYHGGAIDWTKKDSPAAKRRLAILNRLSEMRRTNPAFDAPAAPVRWLELGDPEKVIAFERTDRRGNGFRFVGNLSDKSAKAGELVLPPWGFKITTLRAEAEKRGSDPSETAVKLEVVSSDSVNLLEGDNWDLQNGYAGWYGPPNYHRSIKNGTLKVGKSYVVSCLIRPHARDARVGIKDYGTGLAMTTWSKDWKTADGVSAVGSSLGTWRRVYSAPWTMPSWGASTQIFLKGNPEPDMVRDVRLTPAEAELRVTAAAPRPIRQVRVLDANGATVADTGVMPGSTAFTTNFTVAARGRYRVLAVAADGDLAWRDVGGNDGD